MKALVVYESMFGNTRLIAEAVASGLGRHLTVETAEVGQSPGLDPEIDLVVVGGPTHAFGMSRPSTRKSAIEQTEEALVSRGIGIREWIDGLGSPTEPASAATFDTRIDKPRVPGSAASAAQRRLRKLGFRLQTEPQTFFVDGMTGPLLPGEYERAHLWGEDLGSMVLARASIDV
jgi:flavorubredoxin